MDKQINTQIDKQIDDQSDKQSDEQSDKQKRKTGMARLLQLSATKKPLIISAAVLSALASIASFVPYIAIYMVVQEVLGALPGFATSGFAVPSLAASSIATPSLATPSLAALDSARLITLGWLAFAGVAANLLLYFAALVCSHLAAFGTLYELKINFASHIAKLPLGFHVLVGSGKLRKIMDENIEKIEGFIAHQLPDIVAAFVAPVVMIVILMAVDWRFGVAALFAVVIAIAVQMRVYGNENAKTLMARYQNAIEEMNNGAVEYVRGISVVKAFRQTVHSFRRLHGTIKAYTEVITQYTLGWTNVYQIFNTLINNIYLFLVPVGIIIGMNTADYHAFASSFLFYLIFTPAIASILMKVMYVNSNSMRIISDVEAMDAILDEPALPQPPHPQTVKSYDVAFDGVAFSYDNPDKSKQTEALSGVSFTARQGEITAVVGSSGGGKSTIAHLIPRFFDVTGGKLTIGGVDVRDMQTEYLMDQVGFVFQDVFLFKQSVMDNIRMGKPAASDEAVIAAAKAAQCHDFIEKLPRGYQTVIGTRGVHLSGGERQRIALARAIVKNAPIVVLDEATAFADPENEHLIHKAFETLMKGKTVIMIAHRLSTIRNADQIVVVDGGKIAEYGTHDELVASGGKYRDMWETYTKTASWSMARGELGIRSPCPL